MTTPPPPAQDGERERLIEDLYARLCWRTADGINCTCHECTTAISAANMLRADATQSAELAALRAQVEGCRELATDWQQVARESSPATRHWFNEFADQLFCTLATPQPVAKEK